MKQEEYQRIYELTKDCQRMEEAKLILTKDEFISYIVAHGGADEKVPDNENEERLVKSIVEILLDERLSARRTKAILDYIKTIIDVISRFEY